LPELTLSSSDGVKLLDSYFWAISRDQDATFSLQWIQDRGLKPGVEYRYALSEELKGVWYGTIIDDKEYDHTRYRIKGQHDQVVGKSWPSSQMSTMSPTTSISRISGQLQLSEREFCQVNAVRRTVPEEIAAYG